ncbi:MAG: NADH-quinone oxidoreductase subunit NuoF [Victivallaceae bacterium]|nr:NADH-quinone oxidoreductase subunit NuoF [Victivallaceae bacterium]
MEKPRITVMVPIDANTVPSGAREVKNALSVAIGRANLSNEIKVIETGSFGPTGVGALVAIQPDGVVYCNMTVDKAQEIVEEHLLKGRVCARYMLPGRQVILPTADNVDARTLQHTGRIVLDNCGRIDPENIEEYIANDGYEALGKALTAMSPGEVITEITESELKGRGGAGFPTGQKWSFCAPVVADQKYVICNADEGEPGTFKDRLILEGDPHKIIEGMALCGYAIGATIGYVYVRGEYALSIERLEKAIAAAESHGLLGKNIFNSGFDFEIKIKIGAGAYICGEETALIESMEGKRGCPRLKPPFPAQKGFKGKPTNVNNVETLANIPAIIRNGAAWFKNFGTSSTAGTKVYTILGHINHPGLIEVPAGVTLREIIEDYGGGMKGKFHFAQLGGTAGDILGEEMMDVPMDYDLMEKVGHVLGSGAILIVNESININDFLHSCMRFFSHESCGNCNPCRNGMHAALDITKRLKSGVAYPDDINALEEVVMILHSSAFCPLGQSPAGPVTSALRYFREEIERGVNRELNKHDMPRSNRKMEAINV